MIIPRLSLLKEFQDVFLDKLPHGLPPLRGIKHRIDLISGAPLPNRAVYHTNLDETKEIKHQIHECQIHDLLVPFWSFFFPRVMTHFECVWIVALAMPLPFDIVIQFLF
jgi:hypothetical protein